MKKNVNWWAIIAVLVIGIPVGYAAMALLKKLSNKPEPDPKPTPEALFLNVSKTDLSVGSEGGDASFTIESNVDWKIAIDNGEDWISIDPMEGNDSCRVTLTAIENTEPMKRSANAKVIWTDGNNEEQVSTIQVSQDAAQETPIGDDIIVNPPVVKEKYYLNTPSTVSFDAKSGAKTVSVKSNTDWKVTLSGGDGWLTVDDMAGNGNKGISLAVKENNSDKDRSATLTLSWKDEHGTNRSSKVSVKQTGLPALNLTVKPDKVSFKDAGGSSSFTVKSNTSWEITATGGNGWLTIGNTSGKGDKAVSLKATKNTATSEREAKVTVSWKDAKGVSQRSIVSVTQTGAIPPTPYLKVSTNNLSFTDTGGDKTLSVKSNTDWKVAISGGDWLTVSSTDGNGDKNVTVKAAKPTGTTDRSGKVTFTWKDGKGASQSTVVSVSQKGLTKLYLKVSSTDVSFSSNAGNKQISINSNTSWEFTIIGGDGWLTTNDSKAGRNNKSITLKATKNTTADSRTATVKFSWKDEQGTAMSNTIKVAQGKGTPPPPPPITLDEIQQDVRSGNSNGRIPDNCKVTNNGIATTYGKFRNEVKSGKFDAVTVTGFTPDKQTGNVASIVVKTTVPIGKLTKEDAQKILVSGQKSAKVPDGCTIIVNGEQMKYSFFRRAVYLGTFSNINVKDVTCDANGNGSKITVSAAETKGEE